MRITAQRAIRIKARKCNLSNGVAPCSALSTCYNTRFSCASLSDYAEGTQDIWFIEPSVSLPFNAPLVFPTLRSVSTREAEINPGLYNKSVSALGKRAEITISLIDHLHHDRGIDPYFDTRSREPSGTFWARWLARNPYYAGTIVEVYEIIDGVLSLPTTYAIRSISTKTGGVSIKAADLLRATYETTAPGVSTGVLSTNITAAQTSFNVAGGTYPESGKLFLGKELMTYTRAGNVFTVVRGVDGSEAKTHDQDDLVQLVLQYTDATVDDVIYNILTTYAGIDAAYIDKVAWEAETAVWLGACRLSRTIVKPIDIDKLLGEILEQTGVVIWFDQKTQKIKLRATKPGVSVAVLDDDTGLTDDGVDIDRQDDQRINVVAIYYDPIDPLEVTKAEHFRRVYVNTDLELFNRYDATVRRRDIFAGWLGPTQAAHVLTHSTIVLRESGAQRVVVGFEVAQKDADIEIADVVTIAHKELTDLEGYPLEQTFFIVGKALVEVGNRYRLQGIASSYVGIRFGLIMENEYTFDLEQLDGNYDLENENFSVDLTYVPGYNWPLWTAAQRAQGTWLSDGNNNFYDGRPPYQFA